MTVCTQVSGGMNFYRGFGPQGGRVQTVTRDRLHPGVWREGFLSRIWPQGVRVQTVTRYRLYPGVWREVTNYEYKWVARVSLQKAFSNYARTPFKFNMLSICPGPLSYTNTSSTESHGV